MLFRRQTPSGFSPHIPIIIIKIWNPRTKPGGLVPFWGGGTRAEIGSDLVLGFNKAGGFFLENGGGDRCVCYGCDVERGFEGGLRGGEKIFYYLRC